MTQCKNLCSMFLGKLIPPHPEEIFVDTRFCTHDLIKEDDWKDHPCAQKNHYCITCINSFIACHKNDLEILMVTTVCSVSKSNRWIERYHMIKFAWSACIVSS